MAGEPAAKAYLASRGPLPQLPVPVLPVPDRNDGLVSDSGPQLTLIQLLPSSTVADGVKLKTGFGVSESAMPGGTPKPFGPPHPSAAVHSGGTREPLQYLAMTAGSLPEL